MPGTLLLDDWRQSVEDRLNEHIKGLQQSTQSALQAVSQPVQQVDPQGIASRLQSHVEDLIGQSQQALQPIGQGIQQAAGNALQPLGGDTRDQVAQRLQQHVASLVGQPDQGALQTLSQPQVQPVATGGDVLGAPSPDTTVQQHDPSPPVQTAGTQLANTPNSSGQVFPLAAKPSNTPTATYHLKGGSDLMAPRGTPVLNMQSGRVDEVFTDNGSHTVGGNAVLIHGDDGLDYYYAHFDQPTGLKSGQRVETGEQIGAVGNSGNAYKGGQGETHLHIGIGHGISNGVGAEGGLGENFDAQKLLTDLLPGIGQAATAVKGAVQQAGAAIGAKVGQGQDAFIQSLQPLAQEVANRTGIDPNVMVAIAANETGWGRSQTAQQQNNLFSIQGDGSNGSRWATYSSPTQAFDAFVNLIRSAPRYAQAWADRGDPQKFVDDLRQAGYVADEPGYPAQGWVDQVKSIWGRLPPSSDTSGPSPQRTAAALGGTTSSTQADVVRAPESPVRPVLYAGANQPADRPSGPTPIQSAADVLGGLAQAAGGALGAIGRQPAGQPAQSQPIPSDVLTNPLGTGNALEQPSARLTGQPAAGIAPPTGPAILPSLGEVKDALLQGDAQGALDALNRAAIAASTSAPGRAIAENQANPPLLGLRDEIANAPVLGGALGMARGPLLLGDDEVLRSREAQTARTFLEQARQAELAKGLVSPPVTTQEVVDAARTLMASQAIAMTGEGFGRPGRGKVPGRGLVPEEPARPAAGAPPEPGRPASVTSQMQRNFLRDTVRASNSDPRPKVEESRVPNEKIVHQNDLTDVVPPGTTVLYHETSVPNARAILERVESGPRTQTPIFTSDNPDLALGQGGKGVTLEFDPARSNGGVAPQKPGLAFTAATGGGQEYTVSRTLPGAVSAIVVRNERQAAQLAKSPRVARAFDFANAEPTAAGGIRIPRRETTAPAPATTTAPQAAPEATGFRAPAEATAPSAATESSADVTGGFRAPEPVSPARASLVGRTTTEPVARGEATAAPEAFAAARTAPGEAVTMTTPTARVTVREGGPPLPPREPPIATASGGRVPPEQPTAPPVGEAPLPPRDTGAPREIPQRPMPEGARPIELSPQEEVARLRLEDFPEDLRPTIQHAAEGADFAREQRRGVIPDAVSEQMAKRYAEDTTLSQLIRSSPAGTAFNEEQIRAVRNATGAQAAAVNDAAAAIAGGDDSSAAIARFAVEAEKLDRLVQVAEGARAETGRSMRAFRDSPQLQNLAPNEAVAQLSKMVGGDRQKLMDAIGQYQTLVNSGAGPVQMANFWAGVKNPPPGPGDWFKLIRYNSMLSGPRTFEVNAISNSLELPWRFARDAMASTVRGRPGEVAVEASGAWAGLDQANRAFLDTLFQGITREAAARGELPMGVANRVPNPVARGIAHGLEMATRPLAAADEWSRAIAYNMSVGRLAAVKASEEGLRGQAWTDRVSDILSHKQTAPQLMQQADGMANRMTFHGDMGNIGQGLQAFTQRTGILGNLILPFLKTTYQITSRGIERSPLGLVGTGIDVGRGAYGPLTRTNLREALAGRGEMPKGVTPLGERLGDNIIGSAIFLGLYSQAADGNISGAGPDEPGRRRLLQSEGWQPYSVRVGNRWVSYANWGPAAVPFAMAAAATETQRYARAGMQPGEMVLDGMRRTAQIAQEQTYLQAIGSAWKGITDPAAYGSQFVNNTITSLLPFGSAINTLAAAFDPNARRVDRFNALDAIQSRLPSGTPIIGGREDVPVAQDVLGRPSPNVSYGSGAVNPFRVSEINQDPVLAELDTVGIAPPGPPSTLSRRGVELRLSPDEQRQVQTAAGDLIAQRVAEEMALSSYQQLEPKAKARVLQAIIERARTQAGNTWLSRLSEEDYQQRKALSEQRKELVPVGGR